MKTKLSDLSPESLKSLSDDLDLLLQLPLPERERKLCAMEGHTPEIVAHLRRLLTDAESPYSVTFIDNTIDLTQFSVSAEEFSPDDRIGTYRIIRRLADGGMSRVWLAERADGHFERQVVIKCLPGKYTQPGFAARLREEAKVLAGLSHPGVAQLLDAGVTQHNEPYLVLEYIEGQSLHKYCDERRLTIEQRVELLIQVCDAVAFLHENLIVHCDLKPANIIVSADGRARVLDFGIARLMSTSSASVTSSAASEAQTTEDVSLIAFTPEYAAPEQKRGGALGTRADVYALGGIAYYLLAGVRPSLGRKKTLDDDVSTTVTLPSTLFGERSLLAHADKQAIAQSRTDSAKRLRSKLHGDIDAIIVRALADEPNRRYGSVQALKADLRAYLDFWPVTAANQTPYYRASKFIARHRGGVYAGTLLFLGLLFATGTALWQAQRANSALTIATAEATRANEQSTRAQRETHNAFTQAARADAESLNARTAQTLAEREAERATEQTALAIQQTTLAQRQTQLANAEKLRANDARDASDRSAAKAISAEADAKKRTEREKQMREFLVKLLDQGNTKYYSKAAPTIDDLVGAGYTRIEETFPNDPETQIELFETFAQLLRDRSKLEPAIMLRQKQLAALGLIDASTRERALSIELEIVSLRGLQREWKPLEEFVDRILAADEASVSRKLVATSLWYRATMHRNFRRFESALRDLNMYKAFVQRHFVANSPELALSLILEGSVLVSLDRQQEAGVVLRKALEHAKTHKSIDPGWIRGAKMWLATATAAEGQFSEANLLASEVEDEVRRVQGESAPALIQAMETLANVQNSAKQSKQYLEVKQRAMLLLQKHDPDNHSMLDFNHSQIAFIGLGIGDHMLAERELSKALANRSRVEKKYMRTDTVHIVDALLSFERKDMRRFFEQVAEAQAFDKEKYPNGPPSVIHTVLHAEVLIAKNRKGEALENLNRMIASANVKDSEFSMENMVRLAFAFARVGDAERAARFCTFAEEQLKSRYSEDHWIGSKVTYVRGVIMGARGDKAESERLKSEANKRFRAYTGFDINEAAILAF